MRCGTAVESPFFLVHYFVLSYSSCSLFLCFVFFLFVMLLFVISARHVPPKPNDRRQVQFAMGPSLPSSYGHSEMDYVGSMVARRSAPAGGGVESGEVRTANLSSNGTRDGAPPAHVEGPQGSIVVQPVSAPSFVVAQRDGSLNGAVSGATAGVSRGRAGVAVSGEENETAGRTRVVEGASRPARGSWRRASDGLGGVVFGGDTPEFKEAEAEAAAVVGIRGQRLRRGGPGHVRECTV